MHRIEKLEFLYQAARKLIDRTGDDFETGNIIVEYGYYFDFLRAIKAVESCPPDKKNDFVSYDGGGFFP